ncbi:hypothetical protein LguiA_008219 [Lonicera macranthoides]
MHQNEHTCATAGTTADDNDVVRHSSSTVAEKVEGTEVTATTAKVEVEGTEVTATTAKAEGITAAAKVEAKVEGREVNATTAKVKAKVDGTTAKAEGMEEGTEECVKLFFHRNTKNDISNRENYIRCKNKLRKAGINYKSYGLLSREYLEALKKVPKKFKNDEATLNRFLDLLAFTYSRAYRRYRGKHIRN